MVFLDVTDPAGAAVEADSATAQLVDGDGDVVVSEEMAYGDGRYRANLGRPPEGTYTLRGLLVVAGFDVRLTGPAVVRSREPAPAPPGGPRP